MKKLLLLLFVFLLRNQISNAQQIFFEGCNSSSVTLNISGTDGTRNIYFGQEIGFPLDSYEVRWSGSQWEIEKNGSEVIFFSTTASYPNPPDLGLGMWVGSGSCTGMIINDWFGDVYGPAFPAEITVYGNSQEILDGDNLPETADNTDFGDVNTGSNDIHTFTIDNTEGTENLSIASIVSSGTNTADFVVENAPSIVNAGGTAIFTVTFTPGGSGSRTATITINNNDVDESIYDFVVQGNGFCTTPSPTGLSSQVYTGDDKTIANLNVTGSAITWYDAAIGGNVLSNTTVLVDDVTYYASNTDSCESITRLAVTVNRISDNSQNFSCPSTVADLVTTPNTGTTVEWYTIASGGTALANTDVLSTGTYYMQQNTPDNIQPLGSGFNTPQEVTVQADGKILVADKDNNAIKRMDADGTNIITLGSGFSRPRGVTVQADGKILVADTNNNAIKRMDADGSNIVTLNSEFHFPYDVAVQVDGKILVVDHFNRAIKRMDADGNNIETLHSSTTLYPLDVEVLSDGRIVFLHDNSSLIYFMDSSGSNLSTILNFIDNNYINIQTDGKILTSASNNIYRSDANGLNPVLLSSNSNFTLLRNISIENNGSILVANGHGVDSNIYRFTEAEISNRVAVTVTIDPISTEIDIKGNNTSITDGDTTPDTNDDTDFGNINLGLSDVHTFTIDNTVGTADLTITSIVLSGTNATDFAISSIPATVTAGNTGAFMVTFTPGASGARTATITINNNDCSEGTYNFTVQGNGVCNISDQTVSVSPTSGMCSADVIVNVAASETGINYYLRDNADNSVIQGPIAGNGNTINFSNETITTTKAYNVYAVTPGIGLDFDGIDDKVLVNTGSGVLSGSYTVEAWVKPNHATNIMSIMSTREPMDLSFDMKLQNGNLLHADIGNGSSWITTSADATFNYVVGQWYHIAYVISPTGYTIYIDGAVAGSGAFSVTTPLLFDANHQISIGNYLSLEPFNGVIDEVRIWNTERTLIEINTNSNIPLTGTEVGLVSYYNFEDGIASSSLTDLTANGYNGTLTSMDPSTDWVAGTDISSTCSLQMTNAPTVTINQITDQTVSVSPTTGVCSVDAVVNIAASQTDVNYYLRDNTDNTIIEGPIPGNGSPINFTAETLTTTKTYNVYATTGDDSYITSPGNSTNLIGTANNIPIGGDHFTIEAWVNSTSINGVQGIVGWGNWGTVSQTNAFRFNGASQLINYWWSNDLVVNTPNLADGNWHHCVATYDGTTHAIYVDGALMGSRIVTTAPNVGSADNLKIGSTYNGTENFNGNIDNVRIWNIGKTAAEITALMTDCPSSSEPNLAAFWRFSEGSGTTITDATSNGNDISFNGSTWGTGHSVCSSCNIEMTNTPTVTINQITDQTVTVSPTSGICSADAVVSLNSSQTGVDYFLRDNADDAIIEGPIAGNGSSIDFTAETITTTKTYNVIAESNGTSSTIGTGLGFDGVNDFVNLPVSTSLDVSQFTIELWVKYQSFSSSNPIISKNDFLDSSGISLTVGPDGSIQGFTGGVGIGTVAGLITLNNWHHISLTFNGTNQFITVDGLIAATVIGNAPNHGSSTSFQIGITPNLFSDYFSNAVFDDLRIWNSAKSQAEIQANMNLTLIGSESNLAALYDFEDGPSSGTLSDLSPNANHGTLVNMDTDSAWVTGVTKTDPTTFCSLQMTNTLTVTITGSELDIKGQGNSIAVGDTTPDTSDDTDFGDVNTTSSDTHIFTIDNISGTGDLTITSIISSGTNAADFVISNAPTTVTAGDTDTFTVIFTPGATGTRTATITVTSDDCNSSTYDFAVTGNGLCTIPEPTGLSRQVYTGDDKTIAELTVTGTTIAWYDAATNGTILPNTTVLVDDTTYYASNTDGCEHATRLAVTVNRISDDTQDFTSCASTVADLAATPSTGTAAAWFTISSGGTAMLNTDVLTTGTYYVEQSNVENIETLGSGFSSPFDVAVQADGKILVADYSNNAIKRMDANGSNIEILGSGFSGPTGIAVQADGKILVADTSNDAIKRMDADGANIVTLASGLNGPFKIAVQADGKIIFTDSVNNAIKRMDADGSNIITLVSGIDSAYAIAVQTDGKILFTDNGTAIKRMNADGSNIVSLGSGFSSPYGIAVQADGKILISDQSSNAIKRMDADGSNIITLNSSFNTPNGVFVQTDGKILISDQGSNVIKRLTEASTSNRVAIAVTVSTSEPTGLSTQIYTGDDKTLADLTVNGTTITWFDAAINGTVLPNTTALVDETTYYASNTDTCDESVTRLAVTVNRISDNTQNISCTPTFGDLITMPSTGTTAAWFTASSGGTQILSTDALTMDTYYVEQQTASANTTLTTTSGLPLEIAVQPDGKILFSTAFSPDRTYRMNPDGTDVVTILPDFVYALSVQTNGEIIYSDGSGNIIRVDSDGMNAITLATGFGDVYETAIQTDGKILVADYTNNDIIRLDANGMNAVSLGTSFSQPQGVEIQADGTILVADSGNNAIKRMNADGANVVTLNSGFVNPKDVGVQADGRIIILDDSGIKRMDTDGSNIVTLISGSFDKFAIESTGTIVAVNSSNQTVSRFIEGSSSNRVAVDVTVLTPEIDVKGNGVSIANGETSISIVNNTDFGSVYFGCYEELTYTIENTGTGTLGFTSSPLPIAIAGSTDFTITEQPAFWGIGAGESLSFTVRYTPSMTGAVNTATISIANNDCDENPYTFNVQGTSLAPILVDIDVYLQGATLNPNTGEEHLMRDDLRVAGLLPTNTPYSDGASCNATVFNATGDNAIVDWVWVELRDATTNTTVLHSQSALLQRDGDVVATDGVSTLGLCNTVGNYYVAVKHRNHLAVMTASTVALSTTTTALNFKDANNQITFGTDAQTTFGMQSGVVGMWSGDANGDGRSNYLGGVSDIPSIRSQVFNDPNNSVFGGPPVATYQSQGYNITDVNMDGITVYSGSESEILYVRNNIFNNPSNYVFGGPPTATYVFIQQLPEGAN